MKLPLTHASCPSTVVSAPIEIVWLLLTEPARWGDFFDVRITRLEPAGSAVIGQRFYGGVRSEVFAYLGEHYLGFGQPQASVRAIKLSMIRLGNEDVREDVVIGPGSRYAIVKVTNGTIRPKKVDEALHRAGDLLRVPFCLARSVQFLNFNS